MKTLTLKELDELAEWPFYMDEAIGLAASVFVQLLILESVAIVKSGSVIGEVAFGSG